ncbi:MAG: hypothetical protein KDD34_08670, partial [Bdellovibrionales bacterium]|nr:hypothetical protein [Bdellovibrionales bacterium]
WRISGTIPLYERDLPSQYIAFHIGGSQKEKVWSSAHWKECFDLLLNKNPSQKIVVIGGHEDGSELKDYFIEKKNNIISLLGKTRVSDLFYILKWSQLCVGGDSVAMHIAALTGTPCLNLSCQSVNFWETGPHSKGSRVLWKPLINDISAERVAHEVLSMTGLESDFVNSDTIRFRSSQDGVYYDWVFAAGTAFEWELIQFVYSGGSLPTLEDPITFNAFVRLRDLSEMGIQYISNWIEDRKSDLLGEHLGAIELGIESVGQMNPAAGVLVAWFNVEKIRMSPQDIGILAQQTLDYYKSLNMLVRYFVGDMKALGTERGYCENQKMDI